MNHYKALQREKDKRWDMTMNGRQAVGYCHAHRAIPEDAGWLPAERIRQLNENEAQFAAKYHSDGHATEEEAYACYLEYLLDHQVRFGLTDSGSQHKCKVCGEWTQKWVDAVYEVIHLCDQHNNRDEVAKLIGPLGEMWSSY